MSTPELEAKNKAREERRNRRAGPSEAKSEASESKSEASESKSEASETRGEAKTFAESMADERRGAVSIVARPDPRAEARARARGVRFQFELSRDDFNVTYRKIVVLPILRDQGWTFGGNERIAFFQSTGTSNKGYEFLRGTYFPTFGVWKHGERFPFMSVLEGDEVIVKANHFKPLFVGSRPDDRGLANNAPTWIYQLLVEYCEKYPAIFTKDFREPIDVKDEEEARAMLEALKEIYDLFKTLYSYFTADWQVAMSIGLSRHMGEGIWLTQFADFACTLLRPNLT